MSYNLKNKNIVILAMTFAVMMTINKAAYSQDAAAFLLDDPEINAEVQNTAQNVGEASAEALLNAQDTVDVVAEEIKEAPTNITEQATDAVNELFGADDNVNTSADELLQEAPKNINGQATDAVNELFGSDDNVNPSADELLKEAQKDADALSATNEQEGLFDLNEGTETTQEGKVEQNAITAPRSPFENFSNAILSKVDNDLFNQMSKIEKQTTILNLELKREDVRNKIEALRAARALARQEAEARRIEQEEKLKDMEAARQAKILEAEEKLRAREIELEKVRQNKMLNDYMNEMLIMNQKWIEKNASLQNRIKELETERRELIASFEEKITGVKAKAEEVKTRAVQAVEKYTASLKVLTEQIEQLKQDILESEAQIQQLRDQSANNPFAQGNLDPNSASTDLSKEYAIMDITGQGDDVVAKIVSRDGTTFTIHKGSVLRGGETVLKITEKYIAFDKKGMKAYLYPGGTIMEYEPINTFNEAEKTPETTEKQSIRPDETVQKERVFGKPMEKRAEMTKTSKEKKTQEKPMPKVHSISFSQGMFAK